MSQLWSDLYHKREQECSLCVVRGEIDQTTIDRRTTDQVPRISAQLVQVANRETSYGRASEEGACEAKAQPCLLDQRTDERQCQAKLGAGEARASLGATGRIYAFRPYGAPRGSVFERDELG